MQTLATITGNTTSAGAQPKTGKGWLRIRFVDVAGTVKLQHSLDDVAGNYEDALDPITGNVISVTSNKTVECPGRMYYRIVGSGGVTNAVLEFNPIGDA